VAPGLDQKGLGNPVEPRQEVAEAPEPAGRGACCNPAPDVALRLAERLRIRAVDLDRLFAECAGDISEYINRCGYDVYARQNVETYRLMLQEGTEGTVVRYHQDS